VRHQIHLKGQARGAGSFVTDTLSNKSIQEAIFAGTGVLFTSVSFAAIQFFLLKKHRKSLASPRDTNIPLNFKVFSIIGSNCFLFFSVLSIVLFVSQIKSVFHFGTSKG
jgi:hypothetical protein